MIKPLQRRTPSSGLLSRLRRNEEGVTAIEFAMVAPIFFGILLMTIETGIVFAASQMFDAAVTNASRQILTGGLQTSGSSDASLKQQFRDLVCTNMSALLSASDCNAGLLVDMKRFTTGIPAGSLALPLNGTQLDVTKMTCANFGNPTEFMLVRGYYQYPVYVAYLGGNPGATNTGSRLLVGSVAMKLEPFSGNGSATDGTGKPVYNTCP